MNIFNSKKTNTAKLSDKNYFKKNDIYFIGLYFYKMCYSQFDFVKFSSWIDEFQVQKITNKAYSNELLNIIFEMVKEQETLKSTTELYNLVKIEYTKRYIFMFIFFKG